MYGESSAEIDPDKCRHEHRDKALSQVLPNLCARDHPAVRDLLRVDGLGRRAMAVSPLSPARHARGYLRTLLDQAGLGTRTEEL